MELPSETHENLPYFCIMITYFAVIFISLMKIENFETFS